MQQTDARKARAAVSFSAAAAAHGYTSSLPGVSKNSLLHNAANIAAQNRDSTALTIADLRARFRKHCLESDAPIQESAANASSTAKKFAEHGSTIAVSTPRSGTRCERRGMDCGALCRSSRISTQSLESSNVSPENKPVQKSNLTNQSDATSSTAKETHGAGELGSKRRMEEEKNSNQLFPPSPSRSTLANTCSTVINMDYSPPVRRTDATKSVAATHNFSLNAALDEEAPAVVRVRTASAGCLMTTDMQREGDVGGDTVAPGVKQGGLAYVRTSSELRNEHSGSVGGANAAVKLGMAAMASRESRKSSAKPSVALQARRDFEHPPSKQRHQQQHGSGGRLDVAYEPTDPGKALPTQPLYSVDKSSYNPEEPQSHVTSADGSNCLHDARQQGQLLSENVYLFSPLYSKSPPVELAHQQSQQALLQACDLQQREHAQNRELLSQAQEQRNSSLWQQPQNSKDSEEKTNPLPAEPATDRPVGRTAVSAPAEELPEGNSSRTSHGSVSVSSTSHPSCVFSSALSSPATDVGGRSNRGLLVQSKVSAAEEVVTPNLQHENSGSPSLKGMAQSLNSIRDVLLRAVKESRQSFVKLRLPPEGWVDGKKPTKKKRVACGSTSTYSSGNSKGIGSKKAHSNTSEEKRRSGRSKPRSALDSVADNSGADSCTDDCHSLKRSAHTGSSYKDKRHAHHGRHRLVKQKCDRVFNQCENQHSGGPDPAAVEAHLHGVKDRAPLDELHQEHLQQHFEQLPQRLPAAEAALVKSQKKQKQHRKSSWKEKPQHQLQYPQQRQPSHWLLQQPATTSLSHSGEELAGGTMLITADDNKTTALQSPPQCQEQQEAIRRQEVSMEEPRGGQRSVQRHQPEPHHHHQLSGQLHHTLPSGPIRLAMNRRCRNTSSGRSFSSPTSDNTSSEGSSRIASQDSTLVSCVAAADALSVFASPQVSHLASPQTADPRQTRHTAFRIPQRLSPSYALERAAVDVTPSDAALETGAAATVAPPRHVVLPGNWGRPPSSPAASSAASAVHARASHCWANTTSGGGQAKNLMNGPELLCSSEVVLSQSAAQYQSSLHPEQNLAVVEAEDSKVSGRKDGNRTEEQDTWRKCGPLSPPQQPSAQWAPVPTSAHATRIVPAAPYAGSPPYREQKSSYRKNERDSGCVDARGPDASRYKESSTRPQELTQQQHAPSGVHHNLHVHLGVAESYCGASGGQRPRRKSSAATTTDVVRKYEDNAPRQLLLPQRAGPRDSLQLSPSSCWDINSSRSRGAAASSNNSSRPQSGTTAERVASEERPDCLSVRLQHSRMHSHARGTEKQHQEQQHTAQQLDAITGQHQQPVHVEQHERLLQSEKMRGQQRGLQKQPQHTLDRERQPRLEMRKWQEHGKDGYKEGPKNLESESSGVACQLLLQHHSESLGNGTHRQHLRQSHMLQKQQQQQQRCEQPTHTKQEHVSNEEEEVARHSVAQPSIHCVEVEEVAARADSVWTQKAEKHKGQPVRASSTSDSDSCKSQHDMPPQKSSQLLRSPQKRHAMKSTSATVSCGSASQHPAQALSTVIRATSPRSSTYSLAVVGYAAPSVPSNSTSPHAVQLNRSPSAPSGSPYVAGSSYDAAFADNTASAAGAPFRAPVSAAAVHDTELDGASKVFTAQYAVSSRTQRQQVNSRLDVERQRQQQRCQAPEQTTDHQQTPLCQHRRNNARDTRYWPVAARNGDHSLASFSVPSVADRGPECQLVATSATESSILSKPGTKKFTSLSATEHSARAVYASVPYTPPSHGERITHTATPAVASIGVAGRAAADLHSSEAGGCKNSSDRANDKDVSGTRRSTTMACYSEDSNRHNNNISERCTEGSCSSACKDETDGAAYNRCTASSSSRGSGSSTAEARCYTRQPSRCGMEQVTTFSSATHPDATRTEPDSHQTQQLDKEERKQLSQVGHYLPEQEMSHDWKKRHGHNQEGLTALQVHRGDIQADHPVHNQVLTTCQGERSLHTPPVEQQPQCSVGRHQSPIATPKYRQTEVTGLAPQESTGASDKRSAAVPHDAQTSYALQLHKTGQTLDNSKMQREGQHSLPSSCSQQDTVTSVMSPKSCLQQRQYMVYRDKEISQQDCQDKKRVLENRQEKLLAREETSEHQHYVSAFYTSPPPCSCHNDKPARKQRPREDTCNKPVASGEVKDSRKSVVLCSGVINDEKVMTLNVGCKAGEILKDNNDCLRDGASRTKGCTDSGPAQKICGVQEEHGWHCHNAGTSRGRRTKKATPQGVKPPSRGDTAAPFALAFATVVSDDDSPVSAECWSYRPACGSSRRSSLCSGSERSSSQHQSPHANDADVPAKSENTCGIDASLSLSASPSAEEKQQNVNQPQVQCQQLRHPEGTQKDKQRQQEALERLELRRKSQQTPPLQSLSRAEVEQPVAFFSPQEAIGSSAKYADSSYLTCLTADASAETSAADIASTLPAGLSSFGASTCEDERSVSLKEHLATTSLAEQQHSYQEGKWQQQEQRTQQQQQHQHQQTEGREKTPEASNQEALANIIDRGEEADKDTQENVGTAGKRAEAPHVSAVCSSTVLHKDSLGAEEGNLKEDSSCSNVFGDNFGSSDNCRAKQQLDDLLDVVQLLLSALEGNGDDLRQQLNKQQLFPLPARRQQGPQSHGTQAPVQQDLQGHEDKKENGTRCDSVNKDSTTHTRTKLKAEEWLRELQQQAHQSLLLTNQQHHLTQPKVDQVECLNASHTQKSLPKTTTILGHLLPEEKSLHPQKQHERRPDQHETRPALQMQQQQQSHGPAMRNASPIPAPASLPEVRSESGAGKHHISSGGVSMSCLPPSSSGHSIDAMTFNVSTPAFESRSNKEQSSTLSSACNWNPWSSPAGEGRGQDIGHSITLDTRLSSGTRSLVTPAFGCNPAEEKAMHETRAAIVEATAAAERASAVAAQAAAAAAQTSGRGAAFARAAGAAFARNTRAGTAATTGPTTPKVLREKGITVEQGAPAEGYQGDAAELNETGAGILQLAAAQISPPLTYRPTAATQISSPNEKLRCNVSAMRKQQAGEDPIQQRADINVAQLHSPEQMQLRPPQLCPVRSPLPQSTTAIPLRQHEEQSKQDPLVLVGEGETARQEKQRQEKQHLQQYLVSIEIRERVNDTNNRTAEGLLESGSQKSVQEDWPVFLPQVSRGCLILPEQQIRENYRVPVRRQQQSAVHVQQDEFRHGRISSEMQGLQPPLTHRSPQLKQQPLAEKMHVVQHDQLSPVESLQEAFRNQAHENVREQPQHREQPPAQQKPETMVSHGSLPEHQKENSTEGQAVQVSVTLLQPEGDGGREALSASIPTFKEPNAGLLASNVSPLPHTGASPGAENSWEHVQVQQQRVPLQYEGSQLEGSGSQLLQQRDLSLSHSHQQQVTQWESPHQQCQVRIGLLPQSSPQQQRTLRALQERLPVERQMEEGNNRSEKPVVLLSMCGNARENSCESMQQKHQQEHAKVVEQLQSEHLGDEEFVQRCMLQQSVQTHEICEGEAQRRQITSEASVWYSPIATGASPDLFAFLREPAAAAAVLSAAEKPIGTTVAARGATGVAEWGVAQNLDGVHINGAVVHDDTDSEKRSATSVVTYSSCHRLTSSTQKVISQEDKEQQEYKEGGEHKERSTETQANAEKDCVQPEQEYGARQQREAGEDTRTNAFIGITSACPAVTELPPAASNADVDDDLAANAEDTNVLEQLDRQCHQIDSFRQGEDIREHVTWEWQVQQQPVTKESRQVPDGQRQLSSEQKQENLWQESAQKQLSETEQAEMQALEHQKDCLLQKAHQQEQQQLDNQDATAEKTLQQKRPQQVDECEERGPPRVESNLGIAELQQTWGQVLETEEQNEKELQVQEVKDVCNKLGECEISVIEQQQQKDEARVTERQTDIEQAGVNELAQLQRAQTGQCKQVDSQVQRGRCTLQDEEASQIQRTPNEKMEDMDEYGSVDLDVELSPSLSSISLPGCSSVHDRSPDARDVEVTFSFCDAIAGVADGAATHHVEHPCEISPDLGVSLCKQPSAQMRAELTPEKAPELDSKRDVRAGDQGACYPSVTGAAEKVGPPSATPLELVLQQHRQSLRPVPQMRNISQQSQSQQRNSQQDLVQEKPAQAPLQLQSQHSGIHQKQQLQQHRGNPEKIDAQDWEQQQDQKVQKMQQSLQGIEVHAAPEVLHEEQQQLRQQQVQQVHQELQQHGDLPAMIANTSEIKSEDKPQQTFGPRVALCCKAPTVDPELLSPGEAAAAAGGGPCVNTSVPTVNSHVATAGCVGYSTAAVLASSSSPSAPSPYALPPVVKQRQQRQQQGQREQTQELDSIEPQLPSQNVALEDQRRQSSSRTGRRCSTFEASINETGGDDCPALCRHGSPVGVYPNVAVANNAGRGDTTGERIHPSEHVQEQRRSASSILVSDCPLQASSSEQLDTAGRSVRALYSAAGEAPAQTQAMPQQKAAAVVGVVGLPYEEAVVDVALTKLEGKGLTKRESITEDPAASSALEATDSESASAIAVPATIRQENVASISGTAVIVPTDMDATSTAEITAGRQEQTAARRSIFRAGTLLKPSTASEAKRDASKAAEREEASKTAVSTSVAGKDPSSMERGAPANIIVCEAAEAKDSLNGFRTNVVALSAEDAEAVVAGEDKSRSCKQEKRRTASVSVEEDSEKRSAAAGESPSGTNRRRRRHSLSAAVLRLSSKCRQTVTSNKSTREQNNRENECSSFEGSSSSNSSNKKEKSSTETKSASRNNSSNKKEKSSTNTKSTSHFSGNGNIPDSRQQEGVVNPVRNNEKKTSVSLSQLVEAVEPPVVSQLQTTGGTTTAVAEEVAKKKEEGAALPTSGTSRKACSRKKEEAKHSSRKNRSSSSSSKGGGGGERDSTTQVLPAAHAPPASIQPRLSYTFFKSHARHQQRHQRQQQDQQQEHQQEQDPPQQGQQQTHHHRSLRQLLLPRRKSFSGSDTSATAETTLLCQAPAGIQGPENKQIMISTRSSATVPESSSSTSLRFLSRRFSLSSSSTVGADSASSAAAAAPVPALITTSTCSSLPPVAASCLNVPSGAPVSSNISSAARRLSSSGSSSSDGTHMKGVRMKSNDVSLSTVVSTLTNTSVFPQAFSYAQAQVSAGIATATSAATSTSTAARSASTAAESASTAARSASTEAASASTAAALTDRRPPPELMRRATALRAGAVIYSSSSSSGPFPVTVSSVPTMALTSLAAAAAAAKSAAAGAASRGSATAAPGSKASWQVQQQFSRSTGSDTSRTDWGASISSSSSGSSSIRGVAHSSQVPGRHSEQQTQNDNITSKDSSGDTSALGKRIPRIFGLLQSKH